MARPELGTKRICPETGRKFYDLNKDPIVSPYTGISYPRSYFETGNEGTREEESEVEEREVGGEEESGAEIVSLEEADEEQSEVGTADSSENVDLGDESDDDAFLPEEEEEDDDVKGIIGVGDDDDEG